MAPHNPHLDDGIVERLARHNNRLVKRTTIEFLGETPEVHWDFNRPVEYRLIKSHLDQFAEPDFRDGKVTLDKVATAAYGHTDEYLLQRMAGLLKPASSFNKEYSLNGLVYVVDTDGHVKREDRHALALRELTNRTDKAQANVAKTVGREQRGVNAAMKRATRINPDGRAELEAARSEFADAVIGQTQLALGSGR